MRRAWRSRARGERVLVRGEWFQLCVQLVERPVCESRSDLAGIHEPAIVVVTHEQRARVAAPLAFALEPAADDELLAVVVFDLDPRPAAPARLVLRIELFGDHTLQPCPRARGEHRLAAAFLERRGLPRRAPELQLGEGLPPLGRWPPPLRLSVRPG